MVELFAYSGDPDQNAAPITLLGISDLQWVKENF